MRRTRRALAMGGALTMLALLGGCGVPKPWKSQLLTTNAAGTASANHASATLAFNADGSKLLFESAASDFGATDTNGTTDVYVRDMDTGAMTLATVDAAGTDSANGLSTRSSISPDGTKVAFASRAGDLGPTDTNGGFDHYVRDLAAGTTTLLTENVAGTDSGLPATPSFTEDLIPAVFSPDGTKVAFASAASDLVATDGNGVPDVFVHDLAGGTTTLVSTNAAGTGGANGWSGQPAFSPDGTSLSFSSAATDLGPADTTNAIDVYLRDLSTGATTLVSADLTGTGGGDGRSVGAVFAPDGSKIAFNSGATNLVVDDTDTSEEVYVRDLAAGTTTIVRQDATFTLRKPVFSPDSTKLAVSINVVGLYEVSVHDLGSGSTVYLQRGFLPSFSSDGTKVVFHSDDALQQGQTDTYLCLEPNGSLADCNDVYVHDLVKGTTILVSANAAGSNGGNGHSDIAAFRPGTNQIAFGSEASDLADGPPDANGARDIYLAAVRP